MKLTVGASRITVDQCTLSVSVPKIVTSAATAEMTAAMVFMFLYRTHAPATLHWSLSDT